MILWIVLENFLFVRGSLMYQHFVIFGVTISTYWLLSIIGIFFAIGLALLFRRNTRFRASAEDTVYTILCIFIGALIGAKTFQLIGFIIRDGGNPEFWTLGNWKEMLPGVGVFYGGLFGGIVAALIYVRMSKLNFWDMADILTPSVLLFHAFGRLGCFFSGCCYGHEAAWGIAFAGGIPLIPVQLFEAGYNILILITILAIRPDRKRPGILLPLYLIAYAFGRFILEFFRGDIGRGIFLLSTSQWISLFLFPAGVVLLRWVTKNKRLEDRVNKI